MALSAFADNRTDQLVAEIKMGIQKDLGDFSFQFVFNEISLNSV